MSTTADSAINDNWRYRTLVRILIQANKWRGRRNGTITYPTASLCLKKGQLHHLPEGSTMQFIAKHTIIPVPKVYCAFERKGVTYLLMEKVRGKRLANGWKARTPESKANLLQQLGKMVESMRRIPSPSCAVANSDGGQLSDCRLPGELQFGPFDSIDAFHLHLRQGIGFLDDMPADIMRLIQTHNAREWSRPVFTHGDLSSLNIMVDGDTITGLIDWETSGWYPYYWEYTTACYVHPFYDFWRDEIDKFLTPYPEELEMEELRRRYFGDT